MPTSWPDHMLLNNPVGTLLNRLFGTTFDVMDETQRRQTTKGKIPAVSQVLHIALTFYG